MIENFLLKGLNTLIAIKVEQSLFGMRKHMILLSELTKAIFLESLKKNINWLTWFSFNHLS